MRRGQSLFELLPDCRLLVEEGVELEGSLLSGVSALCGWQDNHSAAVSTDPELCPANPLEEVHLTFNMEAVQLWPLAIKLVGNDWVGVWSMCIAVLFACSISCANFSATLKLHYWLYRGRLNHGRHFTFRSLHGDLAITLVSDGVDGALATPASPLVARGTWLHIYLSKDNGNKILADFELLQGSVSSQPKTLEWRELNLKVTVVDL